MKWYKVKEKRPPSGEWIWVWCTHDNTKQLIRYMGSQETWEETKNDPVVTHELELTTAGRAAMHGDTNANG